MDAPEVRELQRLSAQQDQELAFALALVPLARTWSATLASTATRTRIVVRCGSQERRWPSNGAMIWRRDAHTVDSAKPNSAKPNSEKPNIILRLHVTQPRACQGRGVARDSQVVNGGKNKFTQMGTIGEPAWRAISWPTRGHETLPGHGCQECQE